MSEIIKVKKVKEELAKRGLDGFCFGDAGCACESTDLFPCGEPSTECIAGVYDNDMTCCNCDHVHPCDYHISSRSLEVDVTLGDIQNHVEGGKQDG